LGLNHGPAHEPPFWRPPGYIRSLAAPDTQNPRRVPSDLTFEQATRGLHRLRSPATVRDKLKIFSDELQAGISAPA